MATPLNTIKNWFKTGLFPTQTQFWSTFDSFWHKDEAIPMNKVDGLGDSLNSKASNSALSSKLDRGEFLGTADDILDVIDDIIDALEEKTDKGASELTTEEVINMFNDIVPTPNIVHIGQHQIFKRNGNEEDYLEPNDFVMAIVEGVFIQATYNGGDPTALASYSVISDLTF